MCINPGTLQDGTKVRCRKCWQCRRERIQDWVGRCIAESKTAKACTAIELTYGRDVYGSADHPRSVILTYSDVQKYFKLLRRHGYPCRYFVVGEYGGKKGRCHWHMLVFWKNKVPRFAGFEQETGEWLDDAKDVRFMHERLGDKGERLFDENGVPRYWWQHGWTFARDVTYASVQYVMKYIQKDIGEMERQGHLSMSKKPPLGSDYFKKEAALWVKQGLAPRDLYYKFDEAVSKTGVPVRFRLAGKSADIFIQEFIDLWDKVRPGRNWPKSEVLDDFINRPRPGSADERRYQRLKPFEVEFPKPEYETIEAWEWAAVWRFQNPPKDHELLSWMDRGLVRWCSEKEYGAGAWMHPARIHERHVSGDPWVEHEYQEYFWHPNQLKGGGQWLVVPPKKPTETQ